jgi:hypothetical protein
LLPTLGRHSTFLFPRTVNFDAGPVACRSFYAIAHQL